MTKKGDYAKEVSEAYSSSGSPTKRKQEQVQSARRTEAVSLRLAGLTYEQIGERLKIGAVQARRLVQSTLNNAENNVAQDMRDLENARLDRAQAVIWSKVLQGDIKSIDVFLRISNARRKLNGLDAPAKVDVSMTIREEMNTALKELEHLVLEGEVVDNAVDSNVSRETQAIEQYVEPAILNQTLEEVIYQTADLD